MRVLKVFLVGLLYGWLLRWVVDKIFMEDNLRSLANENTLLKQRIRTLEARPAQRAEAALLPVEQVQPVAPTETGPVPPHRDDLKLIKGVGPKMEKKLNDAGVYTFDQMSRLTATELQAILGLSKRIVQNSDNLLTQARKFAQEGPRG